MSSSSDSKNSSTSYKPFAQSNYANNNDDVYRRQLSAIDEEIFKRTTLLQLREKLFCLPHSAKSSLVYAQQVTDIVNDDHLLGFLYVENYDVDLALTRLLRYWHTRHKVFGDDYILPLTLYGAMKDNIDLVKRGIFVLLPEPDDRGRSIIYANLSLRGDGDPDKVIQLWWYLIHAAMERPSCRKNGFIVLGNGQDFQLCNFQPKVYLAVIKSGESTFPVKRQASHVCNPSKWALVAPAVKAMLSLRSRQTLTFHNGTSNRLLESLAACSLPASVIPTNMGGSLHLSLEEQVRARLAIEGQADNIVSEVNRRTSQIFSSSLSTSEKTKFADGKSDVLWNAMFEILKEFKAENGHTLVPGTYKKMPPNYEGTLTLSRWLVRQREYARKTEISRDLTVKNGRRERYLSDDRRMRLESIGIDLTTKMKPKDISDVNMALDSKPSSLPPKSSSSTNPTALNLGNISDFSTADQSESTVKPTSSKLSPIVEEGNKSDTTELNSSKKSSVSASSKPGIIADGAKFKVKGAHPGRSGDERMNKAIGAKRLNPNMSHLDAILAGGFVFPNMNAPGVKFGDAKDLDGVRINQRKNQLMRRLRNEKKKK